MLYEQSQLLMLFLMPVLSVAIIASIWHWLQTQAEIPVKTQVL